MEQELRSAVRFPIRLPVAVKAATVEAEAETYDISAGGVLLHVQREMAVGTQIEFTIVMPAGALGTPTDVTVHCTGRVVRCTDEGGKKRVAAVIDEYDIVRS